jgi:phosphatidylglycerophosphate synthase
MKHSLIRADIYKHNLSEYGDSLINLRSPYTLIKAIYYMETASLFLFITQKIIKSPNFITFLYALTGVIGAFLLHSSQEALFYIGIFMVFTKGTFDWADGPLARRLNKTSFLGHSLDTYGAHVSDAAFRVAFIYYTLGYFSELMYLFPILAFTLLVTDFRLYSDFQYLKVATDTSKKQIRNNIFDADIRSGNMQKNKLKKWYFRYTSFLDSRSRSIDSLLLVLLIDSIFSYDLSILLLTLSVLIVSRAIIMYVSGVYFAFNVYREREVIDG